MLNFLTGRQETKIVNNLASWHHRRSPEGRCPCDLRHRLAFAAAPCTPQEYRDHPNDPPGKRRPFQAGAFEGGGINRETSRCTILSLQRRYEWAGCWLAYTRLKHQPNEAKLPGSRKLRPAIHLHYNIGCRKVLSR